MCKGLIGKKLGMTGVYSSEGKYFPVTVLRVGPCIVTQVKTVVTDGYNALQLGFGEKKESRVNKPVKGHLKKSGEGCFVLLREFSVDNPENYELGQSLSPDIFKIGERIDIAGKTKGKGFAGVIKRHGFHGGGAGHGSHSHRVPGSIGCSAWPAKVIKGKKMPGHHGNKIQTTKNLEIIDIRPDQNLILVKGAVPGCRSGLISIKKTKTHKIES